MASCSTAAGKAASSRGNATGATARVERTASLDLWNSYVRMLLLCLLLRTDLVILLFNGFV
jgi:hypothetical protein